MDIAIFRKRLKELRADNNLSQAKFGKSIFVTQSAVAKWESGDRIPDVYNLGVICEVYKIDANYLLGLIDY